MGYYMRYFDSSKEPLTIDTIQEALKKADPTYRLRPCLCAGPSVVICIAATAFAEIEINQPGDGLL